MHPIKAVALLKNYCKERINYISIKYHKCEREITTVLQHRIYLHAHWLASTRAHAINRWHLLHFVALSFFAVRVLRLSAIFFPFFILFFSLRFSSLLCGTHGEGREGEWRATYTYAHVYLRIDTPEGNEFVHLGTRITCFTCRLELLEKFARVFA